MPGVQLHYIFCFCNCNCNCIYILFTKLPWPGDSEGIFRTVSDVLDVRVKRGAELSTDHHLIACSLRLSKPWPNRKSNRSSVTYRIKWEALEDKQVRKQFASSISSKFRQLSDASQVREGMAAVQISDHFISY